MSASTHDEIASATTQTVQFGDEEGHRQQCVQSCKQGGPEPEDTLPIQPPVDTIPDDVLIALLEQLLGDGVPSTNVGLVRATHVCGRWRTVAIGTPSLWTRFSLEGKALTEAFLARSQTMPVSVYASAESDLQILRPHVHRLRLLDILRERGSMANLGEDLPLAAPRLEELSIMVIQGEETPPGSPCIFGGSTPELRTLHFGSVFTRSVRSMTQNVRHLQFSCLSQTPEFDIGTVLEALRGSPRVEWLEVVVTSYPTRPVETALLRRIQLPYLRRVAVVCLTWPRFGILLHCLVLPDDAKVSYQGEALPAEIEVVSPLIHGSRTPLATTKTTLIFEIWSSDIDPDHTSLSLRGTGTATGEEKDGFEIKLRLRHPAAHLPVAQLCRTTEVDTVVVIAPGDVALDTPWWAALLASLPGLRMLIVQEQYKPGSLDPLLSVLEAGEGAPPSPALEVLLLERSARTPAWWNTLERVAATRRARGVTLANVVVSGDAGEGDKEGIAAVAENVRIEAVIDSRGW